MTDLRRALMVLRAAVAARDLVAGADRDDLAAVDRDAAVLDDAALGVHGDHRAALDEDVDESSARCWFGGVAHWCQPQPCLSLSQAFLAEAVVVEDAERLGTTASACGRIP